VKPIKSVPLDTNIESRLFEFTSKDKISHFYAIYDLQHLREKTLAWVALSGSRVVGYMIEYDKRILCIRGEAECVMPLLRNSDLITPMFNIEQKHLSGVRRLYEPTAPADKMTEGLITTFLVMKTIPTSFTPVIKHKVQEMMKEDAQALIDLLDTEPQRALDLLKGFAVGIFEGKRLVSYASSPEMLGDLAIIRGVYTAPEERSKGYATSVCSALVEKLLQQGKDVMLYVSKDNPAAIRTYMKIGFKETGHVSLGFVAKRKE